MKQKFRILFIRKGEPGSIIETEISYEIKPELDEIEQLKGEFYKYFTRKRFEYRRAVAISSPRPSREGNRGGPNSRGV